MASKRKGKEEKQEGSFKLPEFDEKEYLKEQLRIGRGVFVSVIWGVIVGILTYPVFYLYQDKWYNIFIAGVLGLLALYFILPRFKVDLTKINKKSWLNFLFSFGLTWFAVVIISLNPPFSDFTDPKLDDQTLGRQEYNPVQYDEYPVSVRAEIKDNFDLERAEVKIVYPDNSGLGVDTRPLERLGRNSALYRYNLREDTVEKLIDMGSGRNDGGSPPLNYTITAEDIRGNVKRVSKSFRIFTNETPTLSSIRIYTGGRVKIYEADKEPMTEVGNKEDDNYISTMLFDNSEFEIVYFEINSIDGEKTKGETKHYFELFERNPENGKDLYRYEFHASLERFEKGEYNITVHAVDAGGNEVPPRICSFTMDEDGDKVGVEESKNPLPGFEPTLIFLAVGLALVLFLRFGKRGPDDLRRG